MKDVAKRLQVCTKTVHDMVERGVIPHVRVLHAIRVTAADLERFIAARSGP